MKYKFIPALALSAAMLCSCTADKETEITETTTETSATTFNEYILTRGWDGSELLASIFYCGEYHPLPMNIEDYPDFLLSDGILYFPDNSYASAETDANGKITALRFSYPSAPSDFSVYGIDFKSHPSDIPEKVGFANYVSGEEDTYITYIFEGGGITQLIFEFTEKKLTSVYISA
ncbi:MAG: hypothetical protein IJ305_00900 [Oscillospiraceae bacterium]|nr:hypothetical protein [Oscillospiraceae bacterium]